MKTILSFNLDDSVKTLLKSMNIKVIDVNKSLHNQTVGCLLDNDKLNVSSNNDFLTIDEPMMIFYDFNNLDFNNTLKVLRNNNHLNIIKAIVTDTNINWPVNFLYKELTKERDALSSKTNR